MILQKIQLGPENKEFPGNVGNYPLVSEICQRKQGLGDQVYVLLFIKGNDLELVLPCGPAPKGGGGGRPLRPREKEVIELWKSFELDGDLLNEVALWRFIETLKRM